MIQNNLMSSGKKYISENVLCYGPFIAFPVVPSPNSTMEEKN